MLETVQNDRRKILTYLRRNVKRVMIYEPIDVESFKII